MSYFPFSLANLTLDMSGYAKLIGGEFTGNIVLNNANLVIQGIGSVDGRFVAKDGEILDAINTGQGLITRLGDGEFARVSLIGVDGEIVVADGNGITGNPTIGLADVATPGTYTQVIIDSKGRVTSGTNPQTLADYGILDAVPLEALASQAASGKVVIRDENGSFSANIVTADLLGNAATATKLQTGRAINGVMFDGTQDVSNNTDQIVEGATNQYFTNARARQAISASGALTYNATTGQLGFTGVTSVAGKSGVVILSPADVSLGNVTNAPQVINAGGVPSIQSGPIASRPNASTAGRIYMATDEQVLYRDTGASWALVSPAFGGDVTKPTGSSTLTLASVGTAGTYKIVTTDAKGRVIAGSNPTTLVGFGITDGVATTGSTITGTLTLNGGSIVMQGAETVDGRDLSADGAVIDAINQGTGFVSRTGAGTFATRTINGTANQIAITNGNGVSGNTTVALAANPIIPGNAGMQLPSGTTAQRPVSSIEGTIRYNTDTDVIEQFDGTRWGALVNSNDARLGEANTLIVKKTPGAGEFSSVAAAMNTITSSSASNPYVIKVGPGVFLEPTIVFKEYVYVVGAGLEVTVLKPNAPNIHLIEGAERSGIEGCMLTGVDTPNYAAIHMRYGGTTTNVTFNVFNCRLGANWCHALIEAGYVAIDMCLWGSTYKFEYGLIIRDLGDGTNARALIRGTSSTGIAGGRTYFQPTAMVLIDGEHSFCNLFSVAFRTTAGNLIDSRTTGIHLRNGGQVLIMSALIQGWGTGIWAENVGAPPVINITGANCINFFDINIEHPGTTGSFNGIADIVQVDPACKASIFFTNPNNQGMTSLGSLNLGTSMANSTDFLPMLAKVGPVGLIEGGELSINPNNNPVLTIEAGYGYLMDPVSDTLKMVKWDKLWSLWLIDNFQNIIWVDSAGVIHTSPAHPDPYTTIILGGCMVANGHVTFISRTAVNIKNVDTKTDEYLRDVFGPIYSSGSIVSESSTPFQLNVSSGSYWFSTKNYRPAGGNNITFMQFNLDGSIVPGQAVNNTQYFNTTTQTFTNLGTGKFTKHALYAFQDGADEVYGLIIGQAQYDSLNEVEVAPMPTPPAYFVAPVVLIAGIVVQQGAARITDIIDARPRLGFTASSSTASSDHGNLTGLADDDHKQYLLANGTRAMTGNLNMGGFALSNVGNVDGVDVDMHASRHLPNGADPLATAAPTTTLTTTTTNSVGIANSFARSDHTHSLAGVQAASTVLDKVSAITGTGNVWRAADGSWTAVPLTVDLASQATGNLAITHLNGGTNASTATFLRGDGTWAVTDGVKSINLTAPAAGITVSGGPVTSTGAITLALSNDLAAVEGLTTTGLTARTAADTWTTRSLTGTANQITVTNGNGVSGNPTISLATDTVIPGTGSISIPVGTTAQRPASPSTGMIRFNTTVGRHEYYTGSAWAHHARLEGDTFTGLVNLSAGAQVQSYLDLTATSAPILPAVGTRRFYASLLGGRYTVVDAVDNDGLVTRLFRDAITLGLNNTGATIPKGKLVYAAGSSNDTFIIDLATSTTFAKATVIGITVEDIPTGTTGRLLTAGRISGVDTSAFTAGTKLWLSDTVPGGFRSTRPPFPAFSHVIGNVITSDAVNGTIYIQIKTINGAVPSITASSYTIGADLNSSMVLKPSSTTQRTFTFPDVSGTVLTTGNMFTTNITGDATGSGTDAITLTLANTGVTPGTYRGGITVDAKGRITSIVNATTATGYGILSIDNIPIGANTKSSGGFTNLTVTGKILNTQAGNPVTLTNPMYQATNVVDNWTQVSIQNRSATANASSDFIAYPDNVVTDVTGFIDMGITSSVYAQTDYAITGKNEGYLLMSAPANSNTSGNLIIGTDSTGLNNDIIFSTNGYASVANKRIAIKGATGNLLVGSMTDDGTNKLQVTGSAKVSGNITAANLSGTNTGDQLIRGTASQITATVSAATTTLSLASDAILPGTGGITLPSGTTAQRLAATGSIRYNATLDQFEGKTSTGFMAFGGSNTVSSIYVGEIPQQSGTTTMNVTTSAPTATMGTQLMSQVVTPPSTASQYMIDFAGMVDAGATGSAVNIAVFRNSVFIGIQSIFIKQSGQTNPFAIKFLDNPGTTASVTYSIRIGLNTASVWYLGRSTTSTFGGSNSSGWSITQVA